MNPAILFTIASFLSAAFFVQTSRFFAFYGIQPNLFLIALSQCAVFFGFSRSGFLKFTASAGLTIFWLMLFFPFWRLELLTLFIASSLVFFVKRLFSTNEYFDFFVFMLATQALFYGVIGFVSGNFAIFSAELIYETTASLIAGLIFLYLIQKFKA